VIIGVPMISCAETLAARAWCMMLVAISPTELVATVLAVVTKVLFVVQSGFLLSDSNDVKGK
jgi:hypothetical protein